MVEQLYRQLGQRIRAFRTQANLTIEELAEKSDLDTQYLGFIERGQGKPSLNALQRIATALGVEVGELFQFQKKGQQEEKDYLIKQLSQLLKPRTSEEIRNIRNIVRKIIELLPPAKR